jgi:hypothetical protein
VANAPDDDAADEELESGEPSGFDELLYSLGAALRSKQSKDAIAKLISNYADELPKRANHERQAAWVHYVFAMAILFAVGLAAYLKLITAESTGTLLGAVVTASVLGNRRR